MTRPAFAALVLIALGAPPAVAAPAAAPTAAPAVQQQFKDGVTALQKKDYAKARALFEKASAAGHTYAMVELGSLYLNARGVKEDDQKAVALYRQASGLGNPRAMYMVGMAHRSGLGAKKSEAEGLKWILKAADLAFEEAIWSAGVMYEAGIGTKKDPIEAAKWYAIGIGYHDEKCKGSMALLREKLNNDQLAEAKKRLDAWNKAHGI